MPAFLRSLLLAATAALVLAPASHGAAPGPSDLRLVREAQVSPRAKDLTFTTPALQGETTVRVLLPEGYDPASSKRYPVLWLLHGGFGSYRDWTEKGAAEAITAGLPLIVVMPDCNRYGNYTDWHNGGRGGTPMWETFHIRQLLPWLDAHLPTIADRSGRAIAGASMGGGGAMVYAARHPQLFTAAASFSGAVDLNSPFVWPLTETAGFQDLVPPSSVFGPRVTEEVRWRGHTAWDLAPNLDGLHLELHTGDGRPGGPGGDVGDPVESAVHAQTVSFHRRLDALGIPHLHNDYGPGGHTWWYWQRDVRELLPRLMGVFAEPPAPPSSFDFRAIEPVYEPYGWRVEIERPALEFSELRNARRSGFQLVGSGRATVTTAGAYRPGAAYQVTVRTRDGQRTEQLRADDQGRLRIALVLGPGNPYQELSPRGRLWLLARGDERWPAFRATVTITRQRARRA